MADAQKINLKARETALKDERNKLDGEIKSLCKQLMVKADYRTLKDLMELDSAAMIAIASQLLKSHAEYIGKVSRLAEVEDALYG
ncbi:hypothetical protein [Candidatus Electronema sp. JM]|uniref:hypothetical protein n=1 Tax=Candidatus Electronema sp. JM TaxID=3401571 RepID=UPI003AA9B666